MDASSRTASIVAVGRGRHRLRDATPWVLDDPFALLLVGPEWADIESLMESLIPEQLLPPATGALLARARYTEDRLLAGAFEQYVVLGAGFDSFAWRRPDVLRSLTVYEVDHPATQQAKRERAVALSLPAFDRHVFAPVDFEQESLTAALNRAGFDWARPTLFSWLGVTMYLPREAIQTTLHAVAKAAAGSEIVLSYTPPEPLRDELGNQFVNVFGQIAAASGEPFQSFFEPAEITRLVEECRLGVTDHPTTSDLHERYFRGRSDSLTAITAERVVAAAVT